MASIQQPFNEPVISVTDADMPLPAGAVAAARAGFNPPTSGLGETDYRNPGGRSAAAGDVDRYIDDQAAHGDFYGPGGVRGPDAESGVEC
jgi:hypothetical protein